MTTATIKITGKYDAELVSEFAEIVGWRGGIEGSRFSFNEDDAGEFEEIAEGAAKYLKRLGKSARSKAADALRGRFAEVRSSAEYASTFA